MRRAAVVTPYFADRDAVCNDAFHMASVLRARGWEAGVFAVAGSSTREEIRPLAELASFVREKTDLAVMHLSSGNEEVARAFESLLCRRALKYHNVTPAEMFSLWSDELAEVSRAGRASLPRVAGMDWEMAWADSSFNLAEIAPHLPAAARRAVIAPFHDVEDLLLRRPPAVTARSIPRLLTVGRIAQSKGHALLLRVMRYLVHELSTPAVLDIVGKPDHRLRGYFRMLELMVKEFGLEKHVSFHGEIPEDALAERYADASVFICTSEHEGFCVPVVEAMAFGVPIVALGTTAVPETVGSAGIVWEERDARLFAVTIKRLLESPGERQWLAGLGRQRFAGAFSNTVIRQHFLDALVPAEASVCAPHN